MAESAGCPLGVRKTPCLRSSYERAQSQEYSGLERETGLEPATPCLEGRCFLFHRSYAAKPLKMRSSRVSGLYDVYEADARAGYQSAIHLDSRGWLNSLLQRFSVRMG
jgi:hypothetical protein